MLDPALQGLVGALVPVVGSAAGLLLYLKNRTKVRDDERSEMISLLMGLSQSRIVEQGMIYIDRGYVTPDEFEDLHRYLYGPYSRLGGNGTAERIMHAVQRLPFQPTTPIIERAFAIPIRESDPTGVPLDKNQGVPDDGPSEDRRT